MGVGRLVAVGLEEAALPDRIISQRKGETPTPEETVTARKVT